jgi:hypothetical protein
MASDTKETLRMISVMDRESSGGKTGKFIKVLGLKGSKTELGYLYSRTGQSEKGNGKTESA